ncbi:hypothetical protein BN1013_01620 [Candidatus Rubidus massiliensis]|nr:hypothetical protein BN1013_01620 [Candidatus Rubidus massiliensis]
MNIKPLKTRGIFLYSFLSVTVGYRYSNEIFGQNRLYSSWLVTWAINQRSNEFFIQMDPCKFKYVKTNQLDSSQIAMYIKPLKGQDIYSL